MTPTVDDSIPTKRREDLKRLSRFSGTRVPTELMSRLSFQDALRALLESDAASMSLVTLEEIIEINKEVSIWTSSLLTSSLRNLKSRNPDVIVGETNVSTDKTVAGTVESRTRRLGPQVREYDPDPNLVDIFQVWFEMLVSLQSDLKQHGWPDIQTMQLIVEAMKSWTIGVFATQNSKTFPSVPTKIGRFFVPKKELRTFSFERKKRTVSDDQTHLNTIRALKAEKNFLSYLVRKNKKRQQPKRAFSQKTKVRRQN